MLGIVFATWEKFISEHYEVTVLQEYHKAVGGMVEKTPLANHVYDDEAFSQGLYVVGQLTNTQPDRLLRQFGRFYINYGLTRHLCSFLLSQTNCAHDLLLTMRQAHIQMAISPDGLTPPVFSFEYLTADKNNLLITYESPRNLCGWLWGAIEGAADRFGKTVYIQERACIKHGVRHCLFEVHFDPVAANKTARTPEQEARWVAQQQLASLVLTVLPDREEGLTLFEIQQRLRSTNAHPQQIRPGILLETLQVPTHTGLLASTANRPGDVLGSRRYWRVPIAQ